MCLAGTNGGFYTDKIADSPPPTRARSTASLQAARKASHKSPWLHALAGEGTRPAKAPAAARKRRRS